MNRNQWWICAVIFFLVSMFFMWDAIIQATTASMLLRPDMDIINSNLYNAQTIRSAIYGSIGVICFALFWICIACGYFEKGDKKK